ncbi:MAG: shikimate kinase [Proteobacteria bacterium]|nr:shikimate kinase [Pseudomonadota bacterium]MBU1387534.1 shikimate kinase [Pseudomonadota bacterium]MBU1544009.1 shikimate kinase [Pseudomonadota bacterium]MBU2429911.1 shikimate kinase [Pseudomonadota bacterium]MBU2479731.1 shikimate kinase [Pseudomonadota bacterium]
MNIILIGYRGTGKSVVGEIVAKKLGMTCIGMDSNIVKAADMSIPQIVQTSGWTKFRDLETLETLKIQHMDNVVVDTGGGVIEREENRDILKKSGRVFWLTASVGTIVDRIQDDTQRPALVDGKTFTEEVAQVLESRISKYKAACEFEINTDILTPEQIADQIIDTLKSH